MVVPTHASAKSPHMVVFAAAATVISVVQIIIGQQPTSLSASVSPVMATSWSILCGLGGISIIVGTYIKEAPTGLMVEAAGHFAIVTGYLAYCLALLQHMGHPWYLTTTFWWSFAFVVASAIRWFLIHRVIRKAKRKVRRRQLLEGRGDTDGH